MPAVLVARIEAVVVSYRSLTFAALLLLSTGPVDCRWGAATVRKRAFFLIKTSIAWMYIACIIYRLEQRLIVLFALSGSGDRFKALQNRPCNFSSPS